MKGVIYKVTNQVNRKHYFGQSVRQSTEGRWKQHLKAARRGSKLSIHCAIRKYSPESFILTTLHSRIQSKQRLNILEKRYIKRFKSNNPRYGYNSTTGGDGAYLSLEIRRKTNLLLKTAMLGNKNALGYHQSKETRQKNSESHKGKPGGLGMLGKRHSKESRLKMSKAHKGKKPWNKGLFGICSKETRRKMREAKKGTQLPKRTRLKIGKSLLRYWGNKRKEHKK